MNSGVMVSAVVACAALAGWGATVEVANTKELFDAVAAATKDAAATKEIVLRAGRYFLEKPLEFGGEGANGLTLRAEKPGAAVFCGGVRVTGWKAVPGMPYFAADVKRPDGTPAFFRALIKNDTWVETAVLPGGTNRFQHTARFNAFLLPNLAGHWSRKPTDEENRVMPFRAADIPDSMDLTSADLHYFHMWGDSLCTVESIERAAKTLKIVETPGWPMGAQGKFEYEIFNVREGLTPGRWCLDRKAGKAYYRPLAGEDLSKLEFVRPVLKHVLVISKCKNVTLDGIVVTAATPELKDRVSYGGAGLPAAVDLHDVEGLVLNRVRVTNVGGMGLSAGGCNGLKATDCEFSFTGACALQLSAKGALVERCLIADAGKVHRASSGTFVSGREVVLRGNEIRNIPYSGIIGFGNRNRFETNYIHHVMRVFHDGAAIYGLHVDGVMRGNVVRDVVACGTGFGVHAYYADEGSRNTVVEGNYAEGMPVPIHNHMSAGIVVRDNTLVNRGGDLVISFERSVESTFADNRLVCGGKLDTVWLDGIRDWHGNLVFSETAPPREWTPPRPPQPPREPLAVPRAETAPAIDGAFAEGEWSGDFHHIDRRGDGRQTGFSSALVRFAWDDANLYASFLAANFADGKMSFGSAWGKDDGVELDLGKGRAIRAFHSGATEALPAALKPSVKIVALGKGKTGHHNPNFVRVELSVPWMALGLKPQAGLKIPFNARAYQSEFGQMKAWDVDSSGCELRLLGS